MKSVNERKTSSPYFSTHFLFHSFTQFSYSLTLLYIYLSIFNSNFSLTWLTRFAQECLPNPHRILGTFPAFLLRFLYLTAQTGIAFFTFHIKKFWPSDGARRTTWPNVFLRKIFCFFFSDEFDVIAKCKLLCRQSTFKGAPVTQKKKP